MVIRKDASTKIRACRYFGRYGSKRYKKHKQKNKNSFNDAGDEQSCFKITLGDVEDLDDKQLNVIPNSIEEIEDSPWSSAMNEVDNSGRLSLLTKYPLPEPCGGHCPVCSVQLLGLGENKTLSGSRGHSSMDSKDEDLIMKAKNIIEQNLLTFISGLAGDKQSEEKLPYQSPTVQEESDKSGNTQKNSVRSTVLLQQQKIKDHTPPNKLEKKVNFQLSRTSCHPKSSDGQTEHLFMDCGRRLASTTGKLSRIGMQGDYCSSRVTGNRKLNFSMSKISMHAFGSSQSDLTTAAAFVSQAIQTPRIVGIPSTHNIQSSSTNTQRTLSTDNIQPTSTNKANSSTGYTQMGDCNQVHLKLCKLGNEDLNIVNGFDSSLNKAKTSKSLLAPFYHLDQSKFDDKNEIRSKQEIRECLGLPLVNMATTVNDEPPLDWIHDLYDGKAMKKHLTSKQKYLPKVAYARQHHLGQQACGTKNTNFSPLLCTKLSIPWIPGPTEGSYDEDCPKYEEIRPEGISKYPNPSIILKNELSEIQVITPVEERYQSINCDNLKSASKNVSLVMPRQERKCINLTSKCSEEEKLLCDRRKETGQAGDRKGANKMSLMARHASYLSKPRLLHWQGSRRRNTARTRRVVSRRSRSRPSRQHSRQRKPDRHPHSMKNSLDIKMFMKSFFMTSSENTLIRKKPHEKKPRARSPAVLRSPNGTRARSPMPRGRCPGQIAEKQEKSQKLKRNLAHLKTKLVEQDRLGREQTVNERKPRSPGRVRKIKPAELAMINKQIKAFAYTHMKRKQTPPFHAALRRMVPPGDASSPPKRKRNQRKQSVTPKMTSVGPRRPRRRHHGGPELRSLEKRNFNENFFSCLIPKVFR